MAALINSLDNHTLTQFGENGHVEYGWSNNVREKIVQLNFQLVRSPIKANTDIHNSKILHELLTTLECTIDTGTSVEKEVAKGYLSVLYRMIGHTRDIIDGKGECNLSYMMIYIWNKFYPSLALFALKCFVLLDDENTHQYGSWKDLKYFCQYCKSQGDTIDSPLIQYAIQLINTQIRKDEEKNGVGISLAAKWVPREKSSFGWLYESLATDYFKDKFMHTARSESSKQRAIQLCKMKYRKLISELNRAIDTTQIKQCGRTWQAIDFDNVTSVTLSKQKKAFLNLKKNGDVKYADNSDRIQCAKNFEEYIKKTVNGEKEMKGKRVSMGDFTKQAIELIRKKTESSIEKDLLNSQWRDNSSQNGALGNMIAMVDVSGSMDGDPMNVAIALGIRIAEKSFLGKRVMTFSEKPNWVNLSPYTDFVSQVEVIKKADWGMNTNFYAALDMILDAIVENKMPAEDVQDMVLVILSDMQMDDGDKCNKKTLYKKMEAKYQEAGIRVNGVPYKPPHILFWNLRKTNGFPVMSNQPNTSMMSGFSPAILNLFCDQGINALQSCTPWSMMVKILENSRYQCLETKLLNEI